MSPYGLLQEEINSDPWLIFVCCIFCNLTKRVQAEPYFWKVLQMVESWRMSECPDPHQVGQWNYQMLWKVNPQCFSFRFEFWK